MPKFLVTWTTAPEVIEAENEEQAHKIAVYLASGGEVFDTLVTATIVELGEDMTVWTVEDTEDLEGAGKE
jgi:hypothetical protein